MVASDIDIILFKICNMEDEVQTKLRNTNYQNFLSYKYDYVLGTKENVR